METQLCKKKVERAPKRSFLRDLLTSHSRYLRDFWPIESFMASFEHSPSARAWERPRSRHCLTAHGPSAPERRTRKQFLPIAYFMATFAGTFRCRTRHRRARAHSHSTPHSEEKNFTNRIFHGEQCRGLAIYSQLSSFGLKFDRGVLF